VNTESPLSPERPLVESGRFRVALIGRDDIKWQALPKFARLLPQLKQARRIEITRTPTKLVEQYVLPGTALFVKRYLHGVHRFRPVKYFVRRPRSKREWQLADRLEALGVPVVPHLAHGERWSWRGLEESLLVTEGLSGFTVVSKYIDTAAANFQRTLGSFVARMHAAGIVHRDLHLSNLVYSQLAGELKLVDLDKIYLGPPLDLDARLQALATLCSQLATTDPFFEAYGDDYRQHRESIQVKALEVRKRKLAEDAARCLPPRHHSSFEVKVVSGIKWLTRLEYFDRNLLNVIEKPQVLLETRACQLKVGRSSTVAHANGLVIRRYRPHGLRAHARNYLRRSRARRIFRVGYHLEIAGISTATMMAAGDKKRFGLVVESYVVTGELAATPLDRWHGNYAALALSIGSLLAATHEAGFSHRDLKTSNILVGSDRVPYLIDMEGVRYLGTVSDQRAVADLARLARDFRGRRQSVRLNELRMLRAYCLERRRADVRWWFEQIRARL